MVYVSEIILMIKKLLLLRGTQQRGSVLSRKIKVSGKQTNKYKKGNSSVLSAKLY